jgi:hypothetical protein
MNKAPEPDGYTGEFYKTFQQILVPDLIQIFRDVMQNPNQTLTPLNDSYIALIPKKEGQKTTNNFKPISLIH